MKWEKSNHSEPECWHSGDWEISEHLGKWVLGRAGNEFDSDRIGTFYILRDAQDVAAFIEKREVDFNR